MHTASDQKTEQLQYPQKNHEYGEQVKDIQYFERMEPIYQRITAMLIAALIASGVASLFVDGIGWTKAVSFATLAVFVLTGRNLIFKLMDAYPHKFGFASKR